MLDAEGLRSFIRESNHIEGVDGNLGQEFPMVASFLAQERVTAEMLEEAVAVFQPGAKLRDKVGMDVRVGNYIAPPGGPGIPNKMAEIIEIANERLLCPYGVHCAFERLHPFTDGNGRTGRLLWLWVMVRNDGRLPPLGFLHTFYYQTLAASHD